MSVDSARLATGEAWPELRRRSRVLWLVLFASLPGMFLLSWVFNGPLSLAIVTLAFVAAIGWAGLRVASFACPRCGRPFFENWYFFQLLRRECAHCGLPRESGIPPDGD